VKGYAVPKTIDRGKGTEQSVKAANRQFYDAVADRYEEIDGRRLPTLEAWLRKNLSGIRQRTPGGYLLDIGTGSGLVTRCAEGLFEARVGIDLSSRILAANRKAFDLGVTADVDGLPFADNSFDAITCFAVLHHLYTFEGLVSEAARVLRPGGIFYCDHDMDATFSKRFRLLLLFYRKFHNSRSKYRRASEEITQELYDMTEWQENGVDSLGFIRLLERAGFSVETKFHWFGLSPTLDKLRGTRSQGHGWAPLLSVVATGGKW
jgi:ubiquinone/menaquinone biosynthesis C-methylase UbiE